jgi:arylsulfatase A-like enzyme
VVVCRTWGSRRGGAQAADGRERRAERRSALAASRRGPDRWGAAGQRRTTRARIAALALVALCACACGERPRDILLVSIDTLRADRLGSYGRAGAGTPHLDRLAARGARFADAMAPTPITLPSHASLLTGLDPSRHGVRHNGLYALAPGSDTLAERLRRAGFRTGGFVASIALASRHGLDQGFEHYSEPEREPTRALFFLRERPARAVNRDALAWLDGLDPRERVFLFVHYMEPHAPFEPPEPELSRFADDRYQGEVATSDRAFGELLAGLAARGRLRRTLVMVVADHGESLGDHGELSHGIFVYQSTLHVPMILAGPGVPAQRVVEEPVSLVDLMPTVLAAVGLEGDGEGEGDGRSLWPALRGESLGDRALYGESFVPRLDFGWSALRVWRRGREKWISAPRPELYDLERDPGEADDLAAGSPERGRRLAAELAAHVASGADQARRIALPAQAREALDALGYLAGAHEGGAPGARADPKDRVGVAVAFERATRFAQHGRFELAIPELRALIREQPTLFDARLRLTAILAMQGSVEEAIREARALIEVSAQVPHGERVANRAHLLLADLYRSRGELEAAARSYERALEAPHPDTLRSDLAEIYRALGRPEDEARVRAGGEAASGDEAPDSPIR